MKQRFDRALALTVARELCRALEPVTTRLIVAGSLRRRKETVGDVEILFVPRTESRRVDLIHTEDFDLARERIDALLSDGVLEMRPNVTGGTSWGGKNKLALHVATGVPVDLFTASAKTPLRVHLIDLGPSRGFRVVGLERPDTTSRP